MKKLITILFLFVWVSTASAECVTAYFVVPASFVSKLQMDIDVPAVDDTIISSGNLDPTKYYEIVSIAPGYFTNYVVGDRFTGIGADVTDKGTVKEVSSIYPLKHKKFEATVVGTTDTGKKVVHLILKRHWIEEIKRFLRQDDYTTTEALTKAKLLTAYVGRTKESVLARFPELAGSAGTDADGNPIPRFKDNTWSCE